MAISSVGIRVALAAALVGCCAADETDLGAYIAVDVQYLFILCYVPLIAIPICRWLIVRYTAKINAAVSAYAESISHKISAAKAAQQIPTKKQKTKLKPKAPKGPA
ncbi:hypothetical protein M885DRAFT_558501 [Pelagophyceae sp. CCMP2097]|nr:hypothetical protein M885DRAFT_558501 [Pelagophyceae sp. CCMP2097]